MRFNKIPWGWIAAGAFALFMVWQFSIVVEKANNTEFAQQRAAQQKLLEELGR